MKKHHIGTKAKRWPMTYGQLPSEDDFVEQYVAVMGSEDAPYEIRNDKGGADGTYDAYKLYALLHEQTQLFNEDSDDDAGDFTSAVLSTLNIEWI